MPPDNSHPSPAPGFLARLLKLRPEEAQPVLWSCACFFCLLAGYFVLRPVRDAMALTGGIRDVPKLFLVTLAAMLVANPIFSALVSRFPRRVFIPVTYLFFIANLLVFYVVFLTRAGGSDLYVARTFYVWASVFNLFVVSVFWGLMADVFRVEQSKRLYGLIGLGGTLGAVAGVGLAALLAKPLGEVHLLPISMIVLLVATACVVKLGAIVRSREHASAAADDDAAADDGAAPARMLDSDRRIGGHPLAGIADVARSPYLLGICLYLFLYTAGSTIIYFQKLHVVDEVLAKRADQTQLFAQAEFIVQVLTLLIQAFLTGRIMSRLGVGLTLALLPIVSIVGFVAVGVAPTLLVVIGFEIARRAINFALAKPARESLFTVVPREEKYKAKSFIDTFVYRGGDALVASGYAWLTGPAIGLGIAGISFLAAPVGLVWLVVAIALGRRQKTLSAPPPSPARRTCPACGYSLRLLRSDRCPECGQLLRERGTSRSQPSSPRSDPGRD